MTEEKIQEMALTIASAVTKEFAHYGLLSPPPALTTIRALVTTAVYKAAFETIQKQQKQLGN